MFRVAALRGPTWVVQSLHKMAFNHGELKVRRSTMITSTLAIFLKYTLGINFARGAVLDDNASESLGSINPRWQLLVIENKAGITLRKFNKLYSASTNACSYGQQSYRQVFFISKAFCAFLWLWLWLWFQSLPQMGSAKHKPWWLIGLLETLDATTGNPIGLVSFTFWRHWHK